MQKLTENNFRDTKPSFSHNRKKIVFSSAKTGNWEVYWMGLKK
ncbi:MAG: PD40 domain-containing protein [Saprospiraceae bacterium]|nr:PD40 domain-containing protein [Saprospiraceae bacterium]